jgi:protein disulfide-isomerase A1
LQDATTNDVPSDFTLELEAYPTIYFYSSGGNLLSYGGGRTAEMIIDFIKRDKGSKPGEAAVEDRLTPQQRKQLRQSRLRMNYGQHGA